VPKVCGDVRSKTIGYYTLSEKENWTPPPTLYFQNVNSCVPANAHESRTNIVSKIS